MGRLRRSDELRVQAVVRVRYGGPPREGEVLKGLAGRGEQPGARGLGFAGVEAQIGQMLRKSGCESRSQLLVAFWGEG